MPLEFLMEGISDASEGGASSIEVCGIAADHRKLGPGWVFVAIEGGRHDGHKLVAEAVNAGAVAIVAQQLIDPPGVPLFYVPSTRKALGRLAAKFYGDPSHGLRMIGVTGTNGKTTLTYLIEAIFKAAGERVGVIGTLGARFNGHQLRSSHTTPEADEIQNRLARMLLHGVQTVVMEVSSHGLAMDRLEGCAFDTAVFTNLTQDHLDFHKDMESYYGAKRRLFTQTLPEGGKSKTSVVVNVDDPYGRRLAEDHDMRSARWLYGTNDSPMRSGVRMSHLKLNINGIELKIDTPNGGALIESNLIGRFNVSNLLAAVSVGLAHGVPMNTIQRGLGSLKGVPGRLESIPNKRGIYAFVDYAHTPDAIERVTAALAELAIGRLIVVFGCGGDRDRGKRPLMAEAAARHAQRVILTSDNPRTEDPEKIMDDAEVGLTRFGWKIAASDDQDEPNRYLRIADRKKAILAAVRLAIPGDTILVAGKGHEDYQILGTERIHMDDREMLAEALNT